MGRYRKNRDSMGQFVIFKTYAVMNSKDSYLVVMREKICKKLILSLILRFDWRTNLV